MRLVCHSEGSCTASSSLSMPATGSLARCGSMPFSWRKSSRWMWSFSPVEMETLVRSSMAWGTVRARSRSPAFTASRSKCRRLNQGSPGVGAGSGAEAVAAAGGFSSNHETLSLRRRTTGFVRVNSATPQLAFQSSGTICKDPASSRANGSRGRSLLAGCSASDRSRTASRCGFAEAQPSARKLRASSCRSRCARPSYPTAGVRWSARAAS